LVAACASGAPAPTIPSTTGTSVPATTVVTALPTTTIAPTTTIPAAEPVPLVVSRYGVMGYWDGTEWLAVVGPEEVPVEPGETYQVVLLDQPISEAIGGEVTLCEPAGTALMEFDPPLGEPLEIGATAVLATWDLRPQPVTVITDTAPEHLQAAIDVLAASGIDDPDPPVTQHLSADLEGDGVAEEVLIVKNVPDDLFGSAGVYSLAMLRKQIEGEWQTAILELSIGADDNIYVLSHSLSAIADLNGDGKMEIIVDAAYYEGAGTAAYEYVNDDLGPVVAVAGGCGA
jgi:hypothetical protein